MLTQMPRQILRGHAQLEIFTNSRMLEIESSVAEAAIERIMLVFEFPRCHRRRNSFQRVGVETHRFAHLARRHAIAISDYVRSHGRSTLSITPIDILNNAFALIAAGKIEIDVGPLVALIGKKSFK